MDVASVNWDWAPEDDREGVSAAALLLAQFARRERFERAIAPRLD